MSQTDLQKIGPQVPPGQERREILKFCEYPYELFGVELPSIELRQR